MDFDIPNGNPSQSFPLEGAAPRGREPKVPDLVPGMLDEHEPLPENDVVQLADLIDRPSRKVILGPWLVPVHPSGLRRQGVVVGILVADERPSRSIVELEPEVQRIIGWRPPARERRTRS